MNTPINNSIAADMGAAMQDNVSEDQSVVSRRGFLLSSAVAAGGLAIGMYLPSRADARPGMANVMQNAGGEGVFAPNAFVRIAPDDTVTVVIKHIEFGQGPYTGLSTIVAEELDASWSQMRADAAPADADTYKNFAFGTQGTGGSTAIANSYEQMRKAGATARAMLVAAAAERWNVAVSDVSVSNGVVSATANTATFGELAADAMRQNPPKKPTLKDPANFKLIGTNLPKLDSRIKTTGKAIYTLDQYPDNVVTAVIEHAPQFGATLKSFDAAEALKQPGVLAVKAVPQGVAVYAENTAAALKAKQSITASWDSNKAETRSSEQIRADFSKAARKPGLVAVSNGNVDQAINDAANIDKGRTLDVEYFHPFLAHAPMETLDAVIQRQGKNVVSWLGSQFPAADQKAIAKVMGVSPKNVTLNTQFAGGSFGRRAQPGAPFAAEAAEVAKAFGGDRPVKLMWTRDNDIRGGWYRPLTVARLRGAVDASGNITAWDETIATQSITQETGMDSGKQLDPKVVEGSKDLPYGIKNHRVTAHQLNTGVPVLWWRSVGHSHNGYHTETFIDQLLEMAGKDPVAGRMALLGDHERHKGVLQRVADMASWSGTHANDGRMRGVAVHKSFDSYVAQIHEVSIGNDGLPKVHKVWCAVDCGVAVNPNVIAAQMEGGIGYGLSAILYNAVTLQAGGKVLESNFDQYRSLRIHEMPAVETSVIKSAKAPTGVGEPGLPPAGPAMANAWRALTGNAVSSLPFTATANASARRKNTTGASS